MGTQSAVNSRKQLQVFACTDIAEGYDQKERACKVKQEESARERALCQLTECFLFVKVIRGQNNYQEKGCTEIQ